MNRAGASNYKITTLLSLVVLTLVIPLSINNAFAHGNVDQETSPFGANGLSSGVSSNVLKGESFIPTENNLIAIDVAILNQITPFVVGDTLPIRIHQGTDSFNVAGTVFDRIGTITNIDGETKHLDLDSPVPLIPGIPHILELVWDDPNSLAWFGSNTSTYPDGKVVFCNIQLNICDESAEEDLSFRTYTAALVITPDNFSADAYPGEVIMVDRTLEFPFKDGDHVQVIIILENCDGDFTSGVTTEPIDGTSDVVTSDLTITIPPDTEIGSYHCEYTHTVFDDGSNPVSSPVIFEIWINVTPESVMEGLIVDVDALNLNNGQQNSLTKKIENAVKNITNEDPTDDAEACEKLQSFIDQLNAFVNSGKITVEEATPLIDVANGLIWDLCLDT